MLPSSEQPSTPPRSSTTPRTPRTSSLTQDSTVFLHLISCERLLPPGESAASSTFATLKAIPLERKSSRRTTPLAFSLAPAFDQTFALPACEEVLVKLWHSTPLGGKLQVGSVVLQAPSLVATEEESEECAVSLLASAKYAGKSARLASFAKRQPEDLGKLRYRIWRSSSASGATLSRAARISLSPAGGMLSRIRSSAAKIVSVNRVANIGHKLHGSAHGDLHALDAGSIPRLDRFVHVDVVRAFNLLPSDHVGSDPLLWTSDPFVTATLLPVAEQGEVVHTTHRVATLQPVWQQELILRRVPGARAVLLRVYDKDLTSGPDFLGEAVVELPRKPPPVSAPLGTVHPHPLVTEGTFALRAPADKQAPLQAIIGKLEAANAGHVHKNAPFGELEVRVSWGLGVRQPDVNLRPALRTRLGRLRVCVHCASELPERHTASNLLAGSCVPLAVASLEHQRGVTPLGEGSHTAPVWGAGSEFTFALTEVTSDLCITVLVRDEKSTDLVLGEVLVPVQQLLEELGAKQLLCTLLGPALAARLGLQRGLDAAHFDEAWKHAPKRWADLQPQRRPGEALMRLAPAPPRPLGKLCFSVQLELERSAVFSYLAPDVLAPREVPVEGEDKSNDYSLATLMVALGRLLDCILCPLFAPLRTLLYLQSWQAPVLNSLLFALLVVGTRQRCWLLFRCSLPLWLLLTPFLNGFVSRLISEADVVRLTMEEQALADKAVADEELYEWERYVALKEATARKVSAKQKGDPTLAASLLAQIPGVSVLGHLGNLVSSSLSFASDSTAALNVYRTIQLKLAKAHTTVLWAADQLERCIALFTFEDAPLSACLAAVMLAAGACLSLGVLAAALLLGWLGICLRHVMLLLGVALFHPKLAPWTRSVLETAEGFVSYIRVVAAGLRSPLCGSGLSTAAAGFKEKPKRLVGAALKEAIEREAEVESTRQVQLRQDELRRLGIMRPVTLTREDIVGGGWLSKLLLRAPNALRRSHVRQAQRANTGLPPSADSSSHSSHHRRLLHAKSFSSLLGCGAGDTTLEGRSSRHARTGRATAPES